MGTRYLLAVSLVLAISGCGTIRDGNGLIGDKAAAPSCYIVKDNRTVFYDYRSKECSYRTGRVG